MNLGPTNFEALIIDPDLATRNRLKQAASSVVNFGKIYIVSSLRDATSRLQDGETTDVVFLSQSFSNEERLRFIQEAKQLPAGRDTAYVLVMRAKEQDSAHVAQNMLGGADGMLFEPYSVQSLVETTILATSIKSQRQQFREKAALSLLISDIARQLDLVALVRKAGIEPGNSMKKLRELAAPLKQLSPERLALYQEVAVKSFSEAAVPTQLMDSGYGGASERVKRRMEQKILEEAIKAESKKD